MERTMPEVSIIYAIDTFCIKNYPQLFSYSHNPHTQPNPLQCALRAPDQGYHQNLSCPVLRGMGKKDEASPRGQAGLQGL